MKALNKTRKRITKKRHRYFSSAAGKTIIIFIYVRILWKLHPNEYLMNTEW